MKMTFRWYGSNSDPIPLKYIKQIPGMTGLMGLLDKPAGVVWEEAEIKSLVDEVHSAGLEIEVIESVNVHEDISIITVLFSFEADGEFTIVIGLNY